MAGIGILKFNRASHGYIMGTFKHDSKDTREENEYHTNEYIKRELTHNNLQMTSRGTPEETFAYFKKRISELDAASSTRKDRVELIGMVIDIPDAITLMGHEKELEWLKAANGILTTFCGGRKNVVNAYYHFDERHKYIDPETKKERMSLNHAHYYAIPEVNGRLSGKMFSSRARLIQLNNELDEMTYRNFGVRYCTGEKKKSRSTVTHLKEQSKMAEIELKLAQANETMLKLEKALNEANTRSEEAIKAKKTAKRLQNEYMEHLEALLPVKDMLQDTLNELTKVLTRERASMALQRFAPAIKTANKALEEVGEEPIQIDSEIIDLDEI